MTFNTALKKAIAKRGAFPTTDGESIDFNDPATEGMIRDILIETLRSAGYMTFWVMVARAWHVPTVLES